MILCTAYSAIESAISAENIPYRNEQVNTLMKLLFLLLAAVPIAASEGDRLSGFQDCLLQCEKLMDCGYANSLAQIELQQQQEEELIQPVAQPVRPPEKRDISAGSEVKELPQYELKDFLDNYRLSWITKTVFQWDCILDCNYKCQQFITNQRELGGLSMVQFYGKWPFSRVMGITEIMLVLFSIGNYYANWLNLSKILTQYNKTRKSGNESSIMYKQYLYLLVGSLVGWGFSTLFHTRDTSFTETLDYFGAAMIMLLNFNAIAIRYFRLFKSNMAKQRTIFLSLLVAIFIFHCVKLHNKWDYQYNTYFNLFFGVLAIVLWIMHSLRVNNVYNKDSRMYNNSIQLLPFETKILSKLNYLSLSETRYIPLLPVMLNLWLILGMSFELLDFPPWFRLIDAHAIWHLFTIIPPIFWYDWNIWDIELMKLTNI